MRETPTYNILGVQINALSTSDFFAILAETIRSTRQCVIANHNLHSVYLWHHDEKMRAYYEQAQYVYVDGMALIWLGKLSGHPLRLEDRPTCAEYMRPVLAEAAQQGWRVFYLGSKPGAADRAADIFRREFAGLQLSTAHGYFDARPSSVENRRKIELINSFQPNILFVGMGSPRQERWVFDNIEHLKANVIIAVGGCMDLFAEEIPNAPRWMGPLRLEWLFRLLSEPRRLWKRYLLEPWFLLAWMLRERIKRSSHRFRSG
jgi:N-acetylglucosaminyldiphosphoundecaprenol N-acetyl-beta-D-mannosaminyltransferase